LIFESVTPAKPMQEANLLRGEAIISAGDIAAFLRMRRLL
jgi:hypothetical protein